MQLRQLLLQFIALIVSPGALTKGCAGPIQDWLTLAGLGQAGLQMAAAHLGRPAMKAAERSAFRHGTSRGDAFGLRLLHLPHQGNAKIFTK
jgi:hypothetical protein